MARTEHKLEKAQTKAEKAESSLPHERVIQSEKTVNGKSGKPKRRLKFEKQVKPSDKAANPVVSKTKGIVTGAVSYGVNTVKNEFRKYEEENPALKALDGSIQVGESALRFTRKALELINEYTEREFGSKAEYIDPSHIDLAFTTDEITDEPISAFVNLADYSFIKMYGGKIVEETKFDSIEDMYLYYSCRT